MTAVLDAKVYVDTPGCYTISEADYHSDPVDGGSLSSSGARKLLPPSCPALFRYEQDHPQPVNRIFDFGHAAHQRVLGAGPELVLVDRDRWDTNEVKAQVKQIRADGNVPLKRAELDQVNAMAAAILAHPLASALFDPSTGTPEQSLFWVDEDTGVWCRARLDFHRKGRVTPDYKTAADVAPYALRKAMFNFGYHVQAAWYVAGLQALGLADESAGFVFVAQMKTAPYLVTVFQPDEEAMAAGRSLMRQALEIYRDCSESNLWPGFADDVLLVGLPRWAITPHEEF